jgi:exosortase/archaeosortase family protein
MGEPDTPHASSRSPRVAALAYVGAFFALFVPLYWLVYFVLGDALHGYFAWLAWSVYQLFALFDPAVGHRANVLIYQGQDSLRVVEGCDGLTFAILLFSAILAFPGRLKHRLTGAFLAITAVLAFNWARLVILAALRFYVDDYFRTFHVYVFQPVMILFTLAAFVFWIIHSDSRKPAS